MRYESRKPHKPKVRLMGSRWEINSQTGLCEVYDLPITVTIQYADGRVQEEVVVLSDATLDAHLAVSGPVRSVELNQDNAALAVFDRVR